MNLANVRALADVLGAPMDPPATDLGTGVYQIDVMTTPVTLAGGGVTSVRITARGGSTAEALERYRREVVFEAALQQAALADYAARLRTVATNAETAARILTEELASP